MRLQPDLVFDDGYAVADIKYKLHDGTWNRADVYQITTFAAGYRSRRGALVYFSDHSNVLRWVANRRYQPGPDNRDVLVRSLHQRQRSNSFRTFRLLET